MARKRIGSSERAKLAGGCCLPTRSASNILAIPLLRTTRPSAAAATTCSAPIRRCCSSTSGEYTRPISSLAGSSLLDRVQRSKRRSRQATPWKASDRPTVVIISNQMGYGGAERQKTLLAAELDKRGYRVMVVCLQRFGPLVKEIPHNIRVVPASPGGRQRPTSRPDLRW